MQFHLLKQADLYFLMGAIDIYQLLWERNCEVDPFLDVSTVGIGSHVCNFSHIQILIDCLSYARNASRHGIFKVNQNRYSLCAYKLIRETDNKQTSKHIVRNSDWYWKGEIMVVSLRNYNWRA